MTQKSKPLKICNETIYPGEKLTLALPLPEIFSCAPLHMPIKVVHGKQDGPCLLIIAAMHGNELNGTEIINKLLEYKGLGRLRGTLIMIPVMNVYGLITKSRYLPGGVELDRCFPGSKNGSLAARMAHLFTQEIFAKADMCVDLQTGGLNSTNLPQIYVNPKDQQSKKIAEYFNAPVISNVACDKGMLRTHAYKQQCPYLLYEAGEALRFDSYSIKVGVRGLLNVMQHTGMLPAKKKKDQSLTSFFADTNVWIRAITSGISHTKIKLGQQVKKGEVLSIIKDPFDATPPESVVATEDAVVVGINNLPLVNEGEGLFQLAIFPKMKQAVSELQTWKEDVLNDLKSSE